MGLVIRRNTGEAVDVGAMRVCVEAVRGNHVKLSFSGPRSIPVRRCELPGSASSKSHREDITQDLIGAIINLQVALGNFCCENGMVVNKARGKA